MMCEEPVAMPLRVTDLAEILATLEPVLNPGVFVFA